MNDTQFLLLLGTVWVAPHSPQVLSLITGLGFILVVVCKGLGWL